MFSKVRSRLTFANVVSVIALFIVLGGSSYAALRVGSRQIVNNSIRTQDIRNSHVTSRDIRNSTIRNEDINPEAALAKGFATIQATGTNGPATVLSFGGQQTSTDPPGVSAQRVATGVYDVTFTGTFTNVDNVNDVSWQVTGRNGFSTGSVFSSASTAGANQIKLRVFMRSPTNGTPIDTSFSVQFYTRTV